MTSFPIGDHQTLGPVQYRNFTTRGASRQLGSWWIFYSNYKYNGRPDLECGSHPQVKLIGRGWAGVSPLCLNAQPFLRSQGPRMGYTSELYQCGFEAIGFVCRKSTMMESLCAGDSSSCRWVVLVSPGFPFWSVVMFNRFIWAALWIHIMGMKVHWFDENTFGVWEYTQPAITVFCWNISRSSISPDVEYFRFLTVKNKWISFTIPFGA